MKNLLLVTGVLLIILGVVASSYYFLAIDWEEYKSAKFKAEITADYDSVLKDLKESALLNLFTQEAVVRSQMTTGFLCLFSGVLSGLLFLALFKIV